ncbi:MAG TPA: DUF4012 domain-containing protein [Actinomycetota bacterium]|nr:DUF4012 domain-containing protein [Actinomycetota bacterium]
MPVLPLLLSVALLLLGLVGLAVRPVIAAARDADRELRTARAAMLGGDPQRARDSFASARDRFAEAVRLTEGGALRTARAIPLVERWTEPAAQLAQGGELVASAGLGLVEAWELMDPDESGFDIAGLRKGVAGLEPVEALLAQAAQTVEEAPPPLSAVTARFNHEVTRLRDQVRSGREAAGLLAEALAGRKRYFVAMQTPSELRGTGGLIGAYGIAEVNDGRIELVDFGRPARDLPKPSSLGLTVPDWYSRRYDRFQAMDLWQNINMTPDFPTAARIVTDAAPRIPGVGRVDGVISLDPVALAALLRTTGPVRTEGWPEPISHRNVVAVLGNEFYARYPDWDERADLTSDISEVALKRFFTGERRLSRDGLAALGASVSGRHFQFFFTDPALQGKVEEMGASGSLDAPGLPVFGVVAQNASGHKADYYMRRLVIYDVEVLPDGLVSVRVNVRLHNRAPREGQPAYVIGPYKGSGDEPGLNRSYLSIYAPPGAEIVEARTDTGATALETGTEKGLSVFSTFVEVPAGGFRKISATLLIPGLVTDDGSGPQLRARMRTQPLMFPDRTFVRLIGNGWDVSGVEGDPAPIRGDVFGLLWSSSDGTDVDVRANVARR